MIMVLLSFLGLVVIIIIGDGNIANDDVNYYSI